MFGLGFTRKRDGTCGGALPVIHLCSRGELVSSLVSCVSRSQALEVPFCAGGLHCYEKTLLSGFGYSAQRACGGLLIARSTRTAAAALTATRGTETTAVTVTSCKYTEISVVD